MAAANRKGLYGALAFSIILEISSAISQEIVPDGLFLKDENFKVFIRGQEELKAITDDPGVIIMDVIYFEFENLDPVVRYFDSRNEISLPLNYGITNADDLGRAVPIVLSAIGKGQRGP